MKAKELTALAVLTLVSVLATAWVLRTSAPTVASDRRGERVAPVLMTKANDTTGITIRDGGGTLAIERRDNRFVAAESGYPIKTDAVRDIVASAAELTFEEARTRDPARYGDLGLADPGTDNAGKEITLRAGAEELASFVVGNRDTTVGGAAGGVFIRLKGQPQTFLARGEVRLPSLRSDWFVPLDLNVKRNEIKKVELSGGGREGVTVTANPDKPGDLVLADIPEKRTADTFKLSRLLTPIESLSFQDVRKATKPADDARRMTVDAGDGLQITVTSVGDLTEGWVQIAAQATGDAGKDKAALIGSKVAGYDFKLPSNLAEVLGWTVTDVTDEPRG
jgi:Domain of unknown function (DUF4340)